LYTGDVSSRRGKKISVLSHSSFTNGISLFGVSLMQAYTYFSNNEDGLRLKTFVTTIMGLQIISMALQSQIGYHYLVQNFGQYGVVDRWTVTFIAEMFTSCLICFLSQMFCASRLFLLMKGLYGRRLRVILPGAIVLFSLSALATSIRVGTIVLGVSGEAMRVQRDHNMEICILFAVTNVSALLSDVISTGAMCFVFRSFMTDFKPSNRLAVKLISFSLHRWIFISVLQTCHLVFYAVKPASWLWVPFHLNISKMHVVSLLALLNSRERLHTPVILSTMKFGGMAGNDAGRPTNLVGQFDLRAVSTEQERTRCDIENV